MALRALKECKASGCHELTREQNGYCKDHQSLAYKRVTVTKYDKFYWCNAWRVKRDKINNRYKGTCLMCLIEKDEPNEAKAIHHIEEIMQAWNKRLDDNNLIPLCRQCHDIVHREYNNGNKKEMQEKLKNFLTAAKDIL